MTNKKITFEDFWKAYPLHVGKRDAERAWMRLSAKDQHAAYNGIHRYCEYIRQTGVGIKYPQGWLNGRRWEDEQAAPAVKDTSHGAASRDSAEGPSQEMDIW